MRQRSSNPKPPLLPEGQKPNVRRKGRGSSPNQRHQITLDEAKAAVRQLSELDAGPDHYEDFQTEANAERADRGAAILLATNVENQLEKAIARLLDVKVGRDDLFGFNAPMGSFSHKITMGRVLGIYGSETSRNLEIIRVIRNAFAHAKRPIRFADEAMYTLCNFLILPTVVPFGDAVPLKRKDKAIVHPARMKFRDVCEITSWNLMTQNFTGPRKIAPEILNLAPASVVLGFAPPLP